MRFIPAALALVIGLGALPAASQPSVDALKARIAKVDADLKDAEMPEILAVEDPTGNLKPFTEGLRDLGLGRSGRLKVRVAVFGDSNHTMDWTSGRLRRALGAAFGYGGHGYVAAAKPYEWYHHTEVDVKLASLWYRSFSTAEPRFHEDHYGHAGYVGIGRRASWVEFFSTDKGTPDNQRFSTIDVGYLCRPAPGAFEVLLDGQKIRDIDATCDKAAFANAHIRVEPGKHAVRLRVTKGTVKFFGAAMENDDPGVVVDGLGVSALSVYRMWQMDPTVFIDSLRARDYDLVILHTGSNMWSPRGHHKWLGAVIERIQTALGPKIPILILSPPDFVTKKLHGYYEGHPRMAQCGEEKRQAALKWDLAFWDFFTAMGGLGSVMHWEKKGYMRPDLVHFKPPFHEVLWGRLARTLMAEVSANLDKEAPEKANAP